MLRCLPLLKACNQQVDYVDKRHCNLFAVPDDVLRYASTLEELLLDANQIRELPRGLFRLQELRKLTLSDNEICRLPPDVANFTYLQELDISRNDIEDIPENIKYCKNLQVADFSSNPLQRLPDGFTHLKNLTHLGLNDVSLTRLPTDVGSLSNLESLELRENLIKYLPASLSYLVKLKTLDLGSNLIDELPDTIGSLPSLEELWLDCNEISELPPAIGNLKKLTQLDVSENKLDQLPEEIAGLTQLTDCILSQNHLEYLPDGIGNLKKLLILKVDQNQLIRLTPNIGNCENLQELLLTENLLAELPTTIGRLKMLTILNVDRNQLSEIPREIGNCVHLGVLSLRDNRIARLPNELGNLRDLHVLDICGNRLQYLPITLGSCSLKAVWLSENQIQPLLKFQTDTDEATGLKVLTCFLLPQQAYQLDCVESLMRDNNATGDQLMQADTSDWGEAIQTSVKFAGEEDGDPFGFEESHFVRHNTPHPKELRARHGGKTIKKDASDAFDTPTQQNSPPAQHHSTRVAECSSGVVAGPSAVLPPFDKTPHCSTESPSSRSSEMSLGSKASTVKVISEQQTPIEDLASTAFSGSSSSAGRHRPLASVSRPQQQQQTAAATVGQLASSMVDHVLDQPTVGSAMSHGDAVRFAAVSDQPMPADVDSPPQRSSTSSTTAVGAADSTAVTASGSQTKRPSDQASSDLTSENVETMKCSPDCDVERHVEFSPEVDDNSPPDGATGSHESIRLQRRDTPHHLKNKRVNTTPPPAGAGTAGQAAADVDPGAAAAAAAAAALAGEERIRRILARQIGKFCESFESWTSELPDPVDANGELLDVDCELPPPPSPEELSLATPGVGQSAADVNSRGGLALHHQTPLHHPASVTVQKVIRVLREPGVALGMSVAGGLGAAPLNKTSEGIFISRVADDGPSATAGLRAGDRLLSVNGFGVSDMDHQSVVALLKEAGTSVCLVISREVVPVTEDESISVTLERDENGLGFTIAGGRGSTPYRGNDQSIYISRITEGGAADRDGRLRVGDKLISVNGIDITVAPHDQAVALLTGIHGEISLVVSRDNNSSSAATTTTTTSTAGDCRPPVSSPDRATSYTGGTGSAPAGSVRSPSPMSPLPNEPPAKRHHGAPTVAWPSVPLDDPAAAGAAETTFVPIVIQPPTPNYFAASSNASPVAATVDDPTSSDANMNPVDAVDLEPERGNSDGGNVNENSFADVRPTTATSFFDDAAKAVPQQQQLQQHSDSDSTPEGLPSVMAPPTACVVTPALPSYQLVQAADLLRSMQSGGATSGQQQLWFGGSNTEDLVAVDADSPHVWPTSAIQDMIQRRMMDALRLL